jgi:hypothetical protein
MGVNMRVALLLVAVMLSAWSEKAVATCFNTRYELQLEGERHEKNNIDTT